MTAPRAVGAAFLAALAAAPVAAADRSLPRLFDLSVSGPGPALNVRAAPDNGAAVLGVLRGAAGPVEVVAQDPTGYWGRVNIGETAGWVALRHLAAREHPWRDGAIPEPLRCFGTEPFWSVDLSAQSARLTTPDEEPASFGIEAVLSARARHEPWREIIAKNGDARLTGLMSPKLCSDGMSERIFGLTADFVIEAPDGTSVLHGCCSMAT